MRKGGCHRRPLAKACGHRHRDRHHDDDLRIIAFGRACVQNGRHDSVSCFGRTESLGRAFADLVWTAEPQAARHGIRLEALTGPPRRSSHWQQRLELLAIRIEGHAAYDDAAPRGRRCCLCRGCADNFAGRHVCRVRGDRVGMDRAGNRHSGNQGQSSGSCGEKFCFAGNHFQYLKISVAWNGK
jgi:hypothetical protein